MRAHAQNFSFFIAKLAVFMLDKLVMCNYAGSLEFFQFVTLVSLHRFEQCEGLVC